MPPHATRQVGITGLGFITPIGNSRAEVEQSLRTGRHGLRPVEFFNNPAVRTKLVGTVEGFEVDSENYRDWRWPEAYAMPREFLRGLAPHGVYAFCAVSQALAEAGLADRVAGDPRTGLFCASAGSAMLLHHNVTLLHRARGERGDPMGIVGSICGTLNFNLAAHFRITGGVCGFVSACASSTHALGYAFDEIRLGRLDRVIVVGAEEHNAETVLPFAAMRALSSASDPRLASRPFDKGRDGFVSSGGAVAIVLEAAEVAIERGCRIQASVAGWGQSADGHSVAVSHPEGAGLRVAMERALADAGVDAREIDYVSAHATSTPVGDRAEALALRAVFTERGARPLVSSTKGLTGHPLSMSGALESAICTLAIDRGFVPGNHHLVDPDDACEGLNLPRESTETRIRNVLNNSSGFGGSNVCVVLQAGD